VLLSLQLSARRTRPAVDTSGRKSSKRTNGRYRIKKSGLSVLLLLRKEDGVTW